MVTFLFSAYPRKPISAQKGKEDKGKKSIGSLKTFYIAMISVAVLGVVIAVAMCILQPLKMRLVYFSKNFTR